MQLNLLDCNVTRKRIVPKIIVVEPDYLLDISSIANCFEDYGHHPLLYTVNRLQARPNNRHTILGNFAEQPSTISSTTRTTTLATLSSRTSATMHSTLLPAVTSMPWNSNRNLNRKSKTFGRLPKRFSRLTTNTKPYWNPRSYASNWASKDVSI